MLKPCIQYGPEALPPTVYNRAQIETTIPQSGTFLFPDSVEVTADGKSAIGRMQVPDVDFIRDGHFGVFPGVLQLEFGQQVGAVLLAHRDPELGGVAKEIQNVRFDMMAKIGDVLIATVRIESEKIFPTGKGTAQLSVEIEKENDRGGGRTTFSFSPQLMKKTVFRRLAGLSKSEAPVQENE